jgi:hypothetical protein
LLEFSAPKIGRNFLARAAMARTKANASPNGPPMDQNKFGK